MPRHKATSSLCIRKFEEFHDCLQPQAADQGMRTLRDKCCISVLGYRQSVKHHADPAESVDTPSRTTPHIAQEETLSETLQLDKCY
jgi:hypothetical protein